MTTTMDRPAVPESRRRSRHPAAIVVGIVAGAILAAAWSGQLVDDRIGMNVASGVLGHDADSTSIASLVAGTLFAFVSGFAGTLTACNIAVFGALPTVAGAPAGRGSRVRAALRGLGWLSLGLVGVAAVYGFVAVLVGTRLPQLSTATAGDHMPVRLFQSMVVFGVIGVAFGYLGLAALGAVPDPFAGRPRARLITLGGLIAGFLVGRPYPLFFKLLGYAVHSHDPFYGALVLALQSVGNVVIMGLLAVLLAAGTGARASSWLAQPRRSALVAGVALILLATFLILYWDIRLPANFGYGWFPTMPWNH
ncbi:hypothetical protein GCM10023322_07760 [Rugosimonospora acidiphila]|uniref:Cytochrome C biogenesis protein transmembrane region n=1 Tax=Rugosimonospora acidiphila TaxID=556531 RepID=A0ABP9RJN9_9ACTN